MDCPSCNSSRVYKSRSRGTFERALHTLLPLHYYRCHACNWRGLRFQRRALSITLVVVLGLVFAFVLIELSSPLVRFIVNLLV